MANLTARLEKLESLFGAESRSTEFDRYHEQTRAAIVRVALHAIAVRCPGPARNPDRTPMPEAVAAGSAVMAEMEARYRKEGLLYGPLDDVQVARVREIAAEIEATLPAAPYEKPPFVMTRSAMRVRWVR